MQGGHLGNQTTISSTCLRAAFAHADPKSAKKIVKSSSFLCFWDLCGVKAARKHVDEIDPRRRYVSDLAVCTFEYDLKTRFQVTKEKHKNRTFQYLQGYQLDQKRVVFVLAKMILTFIHLSPLRLALVAFYYHIF